MNIDCPDCGKAMKPEKIKKIDKDIIHGRGVAAPAKVQFPFVCEECGAKLYIQAIREE